MVNHLEGHLFAPAVEDPEVAPPFVALLVSGGHTLLLDVPAWGRYRLLGQTRDDAAGEAFDKVATLLGLGYPGGAAIERLAAEGDPSRFAFPRPMRDEGLEFSFSGLKTAVLHAVRASTDVTRDRAALARGFQDAVLDVLVTKLERAVDATGRNVVVLGGGVACSRALAALAAQRLAGRARVAVASPRLNADNAATRPRIGGHASRIPHPPSLMTVYPFTLHLGPLTVTGYGLMMMVAFLMGGWAIQAELRRRQLNEEYAADIVIGAVVGGLVGAKLWYVALTGASLFERGGFVWYGGFLGGAAGVLLAGARRRVPLRFTMEICAPALALGYALGRVGCFLVQDDYGIPTTLPWGMKFPEGLPATTVANLTQLHVSFPAGTDPGALVAVHPTQIYETAVMLLVFAWLWKRRAHAHGTGWLFGVYLVCAGLERFLIEFVRAKDDRVLGAFTVAQAMSVILVLAGVFLIRLWAMPEPVPVRAEALAARTP